MKGALRCPEFVPLFSGRRRKAIQGRKYQMNCITLVRCAFHIHSIAFSLKLHVSSSDPLLLRQYSDSLCNILQLY